MGMKASMFTSNPTHAINHEEDVKVIIVPIKMKNKGRDLFKAKYIGKERNNKLYTWGMDPIALFSLLLLLGVINYVNYNIRITLYSGTLIVCWFHWVYLDKH